MSTVWAFKLKAARYFLIMLKCVDENDDQRIMRELHRATSGGHLY